jgi:hypothetical protein
MQPRFTPLAVVRILPAPPLESLLDEVTRHPDLRLGLHPCRPLASRAELLQVCAGTLVTARGLAPRLSACQDLWRTFGKAGSLAGHVYVNAAPAAGLPPHEDPYDILVVQLAGRKRWRLRSPGGPPVELVLEPGCAFWLPRGLAHEALPLPDAHPSIHASLHDASDEPERPTPWWNVRHGRFVPLSFPEATRGSLRAEVADRVRAVSPEAPHVTVLLRGSALESTDPHPLADLDLVLLAASPAFGERVAEALAPLGRRVDLLFSDAQAPPPLIAAVLATRSVWLAGPHVLTHNPEVGPALLRALWRAVTPANARSGAPPSAAFASGAAEGARVAASKRAIRAAGVLGLASGGPFTRDLERCVEIAERYGWRIAGELCELRAALDSRQCAWPSEALWAGLSELGARLGLG